MAKRSATTPSAAAATGSSAVSAAATTTTTATASSPAHPAPKAAVAASSSSSSSSSGGKAVQNVVQTLLQNYQKTTPQRTKLLDAFMAFLVAVGVLQFVYCVLAGNYVCGGRRRIRSVACWCPLLTLCSLLTLSCLASRRPWASLSLPVRLARGYSFMKAKSETSMLTCNSFAFSSIPSHPDYRCQQVRFPRRVAREVCSISLLHKTAQHTGRSCSADASLPIYRAFADYIVCSLILHFFCVNFIN